MQGTCSDEQSLELDRHLRRGVGVSIQAAAAALAETQPSDLTRARHAAVVRLTRAVALRLRFAALEPLRQPLLEPLVRLHPPVALRQVGVVAAAPAALEALLGGEVLRDGDHQELTAQLLEQPLADAGRKALAWSHSRERPRSVGQDDLSASRLSHLSDAVAESGEGALRLDEGLPAEVAALGVRVPGQQKG